MENDKTSIAIFGESGSGKTKAGEYMADFMGDSAFVDADKLIYKWIMENQQEVREYYEVPQSTIIESGEKFLIENCSEEAEKKVFAKVVPHIDETLNRIYDIYAQNEVNQNELKEFKDIICGASNPKTVITAGSTIPLTDIWADAHYDMIIKPRSQLTQSKHLNLRVFKTTGIKPQYNLADYRRKFQAPIWDYVDEDLVNFIMKNGYNKRFLSDLKDTCTYINTHRNSGDLEVNLRS